MKSSKGDWPAGSHSPCPITNLAELVQPALDRRFGLLPKRLSNVQIV